MRKTTFALGLGLALSVGAADLAAQQQRPARPDSARAGAMQGQRGGMRGGMRGERAKGAQGARAARGNFAPGQRGPGMLLNGITLTDAQKEQLKAHRTQQQAARKATMEAGRQDFEKARAARQSGDTAALRAFRTQRQAQMTQERDREIAAIRGMLTAEQRTQFDKNVAEMKARAEKRMDNAGERRGARGMRGPGGARGQGMQRGS